MDGSFTELLADIGRYVLSIQVTDYLDIAIMAFVLYKVLTWVQSTKAASLLKGLFVFLAALMLSSVFKLHGINYLLSRMVDLGVLALIVLFQPEIRRLLEQMGSRRFMAFFTHAESTNVMEQMIGQTVLACTEMSQSRTGALIIFERSVNLNNIMSTGTIINSDTTAELIKNIFYNKAPLHDGAMIVRNGRIAAAGCVLPLTQSTNLSKELGMRHRAGIGLSEQSDAVVIIVSEESGSISMAIDGMLKRHLSPPMLDKLLHSELIQDDDEQDKRNLRSIINKLFGTEFNGDEKNNEKTL